MTDRVAHACTIVAEQTGGTIDDARTVLDTLARDTDSTIDEVAELIITGEVDFK
jgi:hypothetical protein